MKTYCIKQRKQTECVEPSGYKYVENGHLMFFCTCAECGITKTRMMPQITKDTLGDILYDFNFILPYYK